MEPALLSSIGQIGLGGIVFVIWYFDQKRISSLQDIVNDMREERLEFLKMIAEHARLTQRATDAFVRIEEIFKRDATMKRR